MSLAGSLLALPRKSQAGIYKTGCLGRSSILKAFTSAISGHGSSCAVGPAQSHCYWSEKQKKLV